MAIFIFSSESLTNIWAGIGAGLWAVAKSDDSAFQQNRITKAKNMKIGSFGIFYCSESRSQSLTTPFIVFSKPNADAEPIKNIWQGEWILPFVIHPLGTPKAQMHKDQAMQILPTLRNSGKTNFSHALPISATTVFSPSLLNDGDWEILIKHLAKDAIGN